MTEYTRPATWDDVATVARYLDEAGVDKDQMDAAVIARALETLNKNK